MAQRASSEWRTYEEVAQYLINSIAKEFGLARVEGKQKVPGASGTEWEIEAKGIRAAGDGGFVIIECRRSTTSRLSQEQIGGLAFRISETGASGAIVVSPLPLQAGAKKVAEFTGIQHVILSKDSTTTEYMLQFLNKVFVALSEDLTTSDSVSANTAITRGCFGHVGYQRCRGLVGDDPAMQRRRTRPMQQPELLLRVSSTATSTLISGRCRRFSMVRLGNLPRR